jgi:3-oxoacyl-[acyl-carrier protein] reductase
LITGASRGIGRAIACRLAADGFPVILNYRSNREAAEAVKATIEAAGGVAELCPFDVADRDATREAIEGLLRDGPPIAVLVNNAGVVADTNFPSMTWDQWESVTRTSLDGFYNVTHPLVMPMIRQKYGRIITMSSVSGVRGNKGQVNYSAAKAGLIGATKSLAIELARRKITVNAVAPGLIETDMIDAMMEGVPEMVVKQMIPARRFGKPEEVADLVGFLASSRAAYITGQVIGIDGGML